MDTQAPPLRCCGGRSAPPEVVADLALIPALPLPARQKLYRVLGPCLTEPVPESVDAEIDKFCRELSLDVASVARAIRAARFFLRQAAMLDLSAAELAEDFARLGDRGEIHATLAPGYDAARALLRGEIARGALSDHGKLVEHVAWRVEHVTASDRGQSLDLPVVVLTLVYREGDRQDRVTLQLLPDALLALQAMCQRLL
jgi:hypothetical protein